MALQQAILAFVHHAQPSNSLQVLFHEAMHYARFLERLTLRDIPALEVETLGMKLRIQRGFAIALLPRCIHQEFEHAPSDSCPAAILQHRHTPDLHVTFLHHHASASDRFAAVECQRVKGARVVRVEFDVLGNVLLFDKDAAANRPRLLHLRRALDFDHLDLRLAFHGILTSAHPQRRQTVPFSPIYAFPIPSPTAPRAYSPIRRLWYAPAGGT